MTILIFEDSQVDQLTPITMSRPACCVTVGSYRLIDILAMLGQPMCAIVRPYLKDLQAADWPQIPPLKQGLRSTPSDLTVGPTLAVNARVVPSRATLDTLASLLQLSNKQPGIVWEGNQVAAIVNPPWTWLGLEETYGANSQSSLIESSLLLCKDLPRLDANLRLMSYPHEVIAANMSVFAENTELRISRSEYQQTSDGVFLAGNAVLGDYVLCDTRNGPIIIEQGAQVGPYTLLRGPLYIGPNSKILEHAAIKDAVSLGHTTKVGGEVEASVVEPYSNKQHHGFLGHSYLGSWINLGAGTCNSDLKNTYGTVNMDYSCGK